MKTKMKKPAAALIVVILMFTMMPQATVFAAANRIRNEVLVYDFLVGKLGLNTAAACGILANIECESDFDPLLVSDGGHSLGLVQWNTGRKTAMINYCNNNGYNYKTVAGQLQYLKYDLTVNYKDIYNYMLKVENSKSGAYEAAYHWCFYFERPANKAAKSVQRGNLARGRYSAQGGKVINTTSAFDFDNYRIGFTRTLKVSSEYMKGLDVMYIQIRLGKLGYAIDIDGYYGKGTAAAVRQFQSGHGLDADGICGKLTWDAIVSASGSGLSSGSVAITSHPASVTVTSGDSVRFTVKATGSGLKYQWYYRKAGASGWSLWENHTTASTAAVSNDTWNGMQVKCVVTDGSGKTAESKAATVTLKLPLSIISQPASVTANVGDVVRFTVKARGTGLKYQWYYKKSGASEWSKWNDHITATTTATVNGTWNGIQLRCVVTDAGGSKVTSKSATVTFASVVAVG